ncbi:hypothetical protein [Koleobacter methoxysyntrophicus]|uniref:hypothetical protein n=1 Tax=Koleobacter methoxysyntrophicus TaxID=2751313 RepID=UPI0019D56E88|nr:hypothetical protein [Koleobacter methoxysyntrophicus]
MWYNNIIHMEINAYKNKKSIDVRPIYNSLSLNKISFCRFLTLKNMMINLKILTPTKTAKNVAIISILL